MKTDMCFLYVICNKDNWVAEGIFIDGFRESLSNVISIKQRIEMQKLIAPSILATHALSGCDSVSAIYGIGKAKAFGALKSISLSMFWNSQSLEN